MMCLAITHKGAFCSRNATSFIYCTQHSKMYGPLTFLVLGFVILVGWKVFS